MQVEGKENGNWSLQQEDTTECEQHMAADHTRRDARMDSHPAPKVLQQHPHLLALTVSKLFKEECPLSAWLVAHSPSPWPGRR